MTTSYVDPIDALLKERDMRKAAEANTRRVRRELERVQLELARIQHLAELAGVEL